MAGRGKKFIFYGAFKTKAKAVRSERRHPGSFVRKKRFNRMGVRYMVIKPRRKK